MKKYLTLSNLLFVAVIGLLLYTPTKAWILRQISFAPSVKKVSESQRLPHYDFQLKGLNTTDVDFNDLKGKVVFINYWATWCPNCVAEKPMWQKLYNTYKDKAVFLFVTNETWQTVATYYQKNNYTFPTYTLQTAPPELLNQTNTIPATYVIDKKGYIRVFQDVSTDWDSNNFKQELNLLLNE